MATDASEDSDKRVDVALSFAGPERHFAESVARHLGSLGLEVFYFRDEEEQAYLLGKSLLEELDAVYGRQARYCVPFLSKAYSDSEYTRHELRAMVRRLENGDRGFLLPLSFDGTRFPELADTVYVPAGKTTPASVARLLFYSISGRPPVGQDPSDSLILRYLPTGSVDLPALDNSLDWVREKTRSFARPFNTSVEYDGVLKGWLAYFEHHLASVTPSAAISPEAIEQCSEVLQLARHRVPDELARMSQFLASVFRPGWDSPDEGELSTTLRLTAEAKYFALYRFLWSIRLVSMDDPHWPDLVKLHPTFTSLAYTDNPSVETGLPFVAPVADPTGVWLDCDLRCGDEHLDRVLLPADRALGPWTTLPAGSGLARDLFLSVVLPQAAERVLSRTEGVRESILEGCRSVVIHGAPWTIAGNRNEDLIDLFSGRRGAPGNLPLVDRRHLLKSVSERLQPDGKWSKQADRDLVSRLARILGIDDPQRRLEGN